MKKLAPLSLALAVCLQPAVALAQAGTPLAGPPDAEPTPPDAPAAPAVTPAPSPPTAPEVPAEPQTPGTSATPPESTETHGAEAAPAPEGDPITRYWEEQKARPFIAGQVQVGALNRVGVTAGYGQPHYFWGGVDAMVLTTTDFGAVYSGLTLELLAINLSLGGRYSWSYAHRMPQMATTFDNAALYDPGQPLGSYASLDASIWGYVPVGPTLAYWEVAEVWVPGKPSDLALFEEYTRFTLTENSATMARAGWVFYFWDKRAFIGPGSDWVVSPGRDLLIRVGANLFFQITEHLSFMGNFTAPVLTPDSINWFTQSWGIGRLTYQFATGEPDSKFP